MYWCLTRRDNPDCFPTRSGSLVPGSSVPRLQAGHHNRDLLPKSALPKSKVRQPANWYDDAVPPDLSMDHTLSDRDDSFLDRVSQLKLQILAEPATKNLSQRDDPNGFAHIGMWLGSERMHTDMTLAVGEGGF